MLLMLMKSLYSTLFNGTLSRCVCSIASPNTSQKKTHRRETCFGSHSAALGKKTKTSFNPILHNCNSTLPLLTAGRRDSRISNLRIILHINKQCYPIIHISSTDSGSKIVTFVETQNAIPYLQFTMEFGIFKPRRARAGRRTHSPIGSSSSRPSPPGLRAARQRIWTASAAPVSSVLQYLMS